MVAPRYCPSIEDKVVKFRDKERHQIFLEPESREMNSIYVQGFSTSMPHDIQDKMVHALPGLENCKIFSLTPDLHMVIIGWSGAATRTLHCHRCSPESYAFWLSYPII